MVFTLVHIDDANKHRSAGRRLNRGSLAGDGPCSDKGVLFQLDPFALIGTDKMAAGASDFMANPDAVILDDLLLPAVPQAAFTLLFVFEDLFLTGCASDG